MIGLTFALADALDNHLGWRHQLHKIATARAVPRPGLQYFLIDFDGCAMRLAQRTSCRSQEGTFDVICSPRPFLSQAPAGAAP